MPRQGIWRFALIFLFTVCLTNAPTKGQSVDLGQENLNQGDGNHLILIFAPGLRLNRPKAPPHPPLPVYNYTSRTEDSDSSSDEDVKLAPKDDDVYHLYHVLRTTEEDQNLDDKVLNTVEKTKNLLRPMLRSRCNQLHSCMARCPRKKKRNCVKKCKVKIDVYAVCGVCRPPKCGRTLPPDW